MPVCCNAGALTTKSTKDTKNQVRRCVEPGSLPGLRNVVALFDSQNRQTATLKAQITKLTLCTPVE